MVELGRNGSYFYCFYAFRGKCRTGYLNLACNGDGIPDAERKSGALRQAGAIEAHSLDEMCDTLLLLDHFGRLGRGNVGAVCGLTDGGGGEAVLISDVCTAAGVEVPRLRDKTAKALVDSIGQVGSVLTNPVDMSQQQAIAPAVRRALDLVAGEPQIDIIMVYENAGVLLDVYPRQVTNAVNRAFLNFSQICLLRGRKVQSSSTVRPYFAAMDCIRPSE